MEKMTSWEQGSESWTEIPDRYMRAGMARARQRAREVNREAYLTSSGVPLTSLPAYVWGAKNWGFMITMKPSAHAAGCFEVFVLGQAVAQES